MFTLGKSSDGKIGVLIEDLPGLVAHQGLTVGLKGGASAVKPYPLAPASLDFLEGDVIIIGRCQGDNTRRVLERVEIGEVGEAELGQGGYAFLGGNVRGRNALALLAADVAGLLYGIEELTSRWEDAGDKVVYRGELKTVRAALPLRGSLIWDHSTHWNLDYPGQVDWGCWNAYCQPPESFVENYRRLIDHARQSRINSIWLAGFLRDAHGGVAASQEVCRYGEKRGVHILPLIGTSYYGGFYYRGDHPFSVDRWLEVHPEYAGVGQQGERTHRGLKWLCPSETANQQWLRDGTRWLFETFGVVGAYLENGDFRACYCDRCKARRQEIGGNDTDYYKDMVASHMPVIEEALKINKKALLFYAPYTGFRFGTPTTGLDDADPGRWANMGTSVPDFIRRIPEEVYCLWTLTSMVKEQPVRLMDFLDDGMPEAILKSPGWPKGLRPPTKNSLGLLHQGTQWYIYPGKPRTLVGTRYTPVISTIKEGCLRASLAGMQGIGMSLSEASPRYVACELNQLALAHFCYYPKDTLRGFASAQLAQRVGGEELAQTFIELLAKQEAGAMEDKAQQTLAKIFQDYQAKVIRGEDWGEYRYWRWLAHYGTSDNRDPVI